MDDRHSDVCRVCRSEGTNDKPLFHPCVCTGSIKYIHQDCLVQWLNYSKKEYCELCKHKYTFTPIYAPDMPKRLPFKDILGGLVRSVGRALRYWLHYTLVAVAWLGVVPLAACRIYRCLFTSSVGSLLTLPLDILSTENLLSDCFHGCFIMICTLCTFISLVWLREQIVVGGGAIAVLDNNNNDIAPNNNRPAGANNDDDGDDDDGDDDDDEDEDDDEDGGEDAGDADVAAAAAVVEAVVERHGDDVAANVVAAGSNVDGEQQIPAAQQPDNNNIDVANDNQGQPDNQNNELEPGDEEEEPNNQGENNWNPLEWDRAAEELTWERLLGLDGSWQFLEHVFWVISLNTLFILLFAFCPFHIGNCIISFLDIKLYFVATKFDGFFSALFGYLVTAFVLAAVYSISSILKFKRATKIFGLSYIVVKVSLLVVMEISVFPLICGWWLDICSLSMFDVTMRDRVMSFNSSPSTSTFIHWLVGMVYIFYFASFILLLREVLRPGTLWFLRNLNDPDFNPIQEMIHLPVYRHIRRFLASLVVFGTIVLVMLRLPIWAIQKLVPSFLPFHVTLSSPETPVSELSLELLLLQIILPALLEQGHTRYWMKSLVRAWCIVMAHLLDLRSYLLGDVPLNEQQAEDKQQEEQSEMGTDGEGVGNNGGDGNNAEGRDVIQSEASNTNILSSEASQVEVGQVELGQVKLGRDDVGHGSEKDMESQKKINLEMTHLNEINLLPSEIKLEKVEIVQEASSSLSSVADADNDDDDDAHKMMIESSVDLAVSLDTVKGEVLKSRLSVDEGQLKISDYSQVFNDGKLGQKRDIGERLEEINLESNKAVIKDTEIISSNANPIKNNEHPVLMNLPEKGSLGNLEDVVVTTTPLIEVTNITDYNLLLKLLNADEKVEEDNYSQSVVSKLSPVSSQQVADNSKDISSSANAGDLEQMRDSTSSSLSTSEHHDDNNFRLQSTSSSFQHSSKQQPTSHLFQQDKFHILPPEMSINQHPQQQQLESELSKELQSLSEQQQQKQQQPSLSQQHLPPLPQSCQQIPSSLSQQLSQHQQQQPESQPQPIPEKRLASAAVQPQSQLPLQQPPQLPQQQQPLPQQQPPPQPPPPQQVPLIMGGLGHRHQAMLHGGGPIGYQPYKAPPCFIIRLLLLLLLMCLTLFTASLISFVVPVFIGRRLMSIWTGDLRVHELYTAACGLYVCWIVLRLAAVIFKWVPQGYRVVLNKFLEWFSLIMKTALLASILVGLIPLLLGLLFELLVVMPIRVPLHQTPIFFPWQDWALGVLHVKILTAITLMGPQWRLKRVIEQIYMQGFRNLDVKMVLCQLCWPVCSFLGLLLSVPYIFANSIVSLFDVSFETQHLIARRIYPFLLGIFMFAIFCHLQARQFKRLYEHIKNDKYLVGLRLVNYEKKSNG